VETAENRRSRCLYWNQLNDLPAERFTEPDPEGTLSTPPETGRQGLAITDLKIHFKVTGGMLSLSPTHKTVKAVDGISFQLPPGKTVGIVGESG
jgi:peptide/nickel transport system ATP-binding protein